MGTSEMVLLSLFPLGFCLRQSSRTIKICQPPARQGTRLTGEEGICTMDRMVPQHFPSPGIFCTGGNISQCQWLILEYINCLRKWTRIIQMTNPDKWQKLLISVHYALSDYRITGLKWEQVVKALQPVLMHTDSARISIFALYHSVK